MKTESKAEGGKKIKGEIKNEKIVEEIMIILREMVKRSKRVVDAQRTEFYAKCIDCSLRFPITAIVGDNAGEPLCPYCYSKDVVEVEG